MSLARKAATIMCAALSLLLAAPRLTTIEDTLYKADGTRFNGTAVISWMPFDANDNSKIGLQSLTVQISNGAFRVQLVPNSDATPVNNYTVQYSSDGKQQFTEVWSVPPSTTPLRIKNVRVVSPSGSTGGGVVQPPSQNPIAESNVIGLLTDLSVRPIRGGAYTANRAAMVNDSGAIDSVSGNLSDCVRVDGSAGPCFDYTMVPAYVDYENLIGVVDGVNATFTLSAIPNPVTSLAVYRNGLLQLAGTDYTLQEDGSLLFVPAAIPQTGDVLKACYRTGGDSDTVVAPSEVQVPKVQVLCSGTGAGTNNLNYLLLGSCNIPAKTLGSGDRVEIRFTLAHSGTTNGYNFQVRWGETSIVQRIASAHDSLVAGRGDASIGPAGTTIDMQTWGTSLTLESRLLSASDALSNPIDVSFLGAMSKVGSDTVSLQNYTVLRYPAQQ